MMRVVVDAGCRRCNRLQNVDGVLRQAQDEDGAVQAWEISIRQEVD